MGVSHRFWRKIALKKQNQVSGCKNEEQREEGEEEKEKKGREDEKDEGEEEW